MTNFTKKQQAEAQIHIGRQQGVVSRSESGPGIILTKKGKREAKLALGKAAAKNLIEGTIRLNQTTDSNNE